MSTPHTPGPWAACEMDDWPGRAIYVFAIHQLSNGRIDADTADCYVAQAGLNHSECEANARLIAAAPELLAVVQELEESAKYWSEYDVPLGIVDRLREAIYMATGGAA